MNHLLGESHFDIIALTETRRNENNIVTDLKENYKWIGKDRINGKGGGISFLYTEKYVTVTNDNLLSSSDDSYERLWISTKFGKEHLVIGVTYFPVDNVPSLYNDAEALANELVQNIGTLQSTYDNIVLVGDYNGKAHNFRKNGKKSQNGCLIDNLIETTNLILLNESDKCTGTTTWSFGEKESTIDYFMCSQSIMRR